MLGTGALAGCGGSGSGSNEIIFSWGPDDTGVLPKLIETFNKQSGGFKVRYRQMPSDTGEYFDQLRTQFQAGGWRHRRDRRRRHLAGPVRRERVHRRPLRPLQGSDEFLPGPMEAMRFQDGIYGVPWYTDAGLLHYRKDLLEKAGFSEPPKTWDELVEQAKKTQRDEDVQFGFVFQGAEYEGGVCNGLEYVWTHGGDVLDQNDPSKVVVESPESVAGLTTQRAMIEDGVTTRAVLQYLEDESHGAFVRGDSVFLRNWPYVYALLSDPKESEIKPGQVGVTSLPVGGGESASALGGRNFFVNANSEKQDQAWEFIRWMTQPEQPKKNAPEGSRLPVRRELYEDAEILDNVPVAKLGKEVVIQNSRPRPLSPVYSDISLEMAEKFSASLAGEMSPEEAVAALQKEMSGLVEQGQEAAS